MRRINPTPDGMDPAKISARVYLVKKFGPHRVGSYMSFLRAVQQHGRTDNSLLTPEVDEVWHAHILNTERYQADCYAMFNGQFLHHNPELYVYPATEVTTPEPTPTRDPADQQAPPVGPPLYGVRGHRRADGTVVKPHTRRLKYGVVCG